MQNEITGQELILTGADILDRIEVLESLLDEETAAQEAAEAQGWQVNLNGVFRNINWNFEHSFEHDSWASLCQAFGIDISQHQPDFQQELDMLRKAEGVIERDTTLIHNDHFKDYAREYAEGTTPNLVGASWPFSCIDWEMAGNDLRSDYSVVTIGGEDYYYL